MGERIRAHDWARTPLGPVEDWPASLKATVRTLLASRYPMILTWGPGFIQFYNDAYAALIGDKHPGALGTDIRGTLAEAWETLGPMIEEVMRTGVANRTPALLLLLERHGYREEAYFSVSHAPAEDDEGRISGMLAVCSEVTQQVVGERRLKLLGELGAQTGLPRTLDEAGEALAAALDAHSLDLPFALLYVREDDGLALQGAAGIAPGSGAAPLQLGPDGAGAPWPLGEALRGGAVDVEGVDRIAGLRGGAFGDPVTRALALPIASGTGEPLGVLVAGISPSRELDAGYRAFLDLLAGQASVVLRNARAAEDERRTAEARAELAAARAATRADLALRESEDKLRLAVEATDLGLWDFDIGRGTLVWSDRMKALYGLGPEEEATFEVFVRGLHEADRDYVLATYQAALAPGGDGRFGFEHRILSRNGRVRWLLGAGRVLFDPSGRPVRAIGTCRDITARKTAEASLKRSEERYRLATEAFQGAAFEYDPETGRAERSGRFQAIVGRRPEEIPQTRAGWDDLIHPDDLPAFVNAREDVFAGRADQIEVEYRVRHREGHWVWVWHRALARRRPDGSVERLFGAILDITERKRAEDLQKLLLDELNHRVKNTLATVQSIAAQTLRSASSPEAFQAGFEGRLLALSRTHNLLTERQWHGTSLHALLRKELQPYGSPDAGRWRVEGEDVTLGPRAAVTLGMALHELATNAAKYGALSVPGGSVAVSWRILAGEGGETRLNLQWSERGGPATSRPTRRGFGSRLIERGVSAELAGSVELDFAPTGLTCHMDVPLPRGASARRTETTDPA